MQEFFKPKRICHIIAQQLLQSYCGQHNFSNDINNPKYGNILLSRQNLQKVRSTEPHHKIMNHVGAFKLSLVIELYEERNLSFSSSSNSLSSASVLYS